MHYVNVAITAVIVFGASFVPGVGVVSDYGMTIAGIFIGLIYGYCTIGMVIPSFMALVALGFSGYAPVPDVLKMSFGSDTVLYIIAILLLSAMLEQCKLSDKLVSLLVGNKRVKGSSVGHFDHVHAGCLRCRVVHQRRARRDHLLDTSRRSF